MGTSTGRLRVALDVQSVMGLSGWGDNLIGTAPQYSGCVNNRYGAGPTHNDHEGADMAKRTRTPGRTDSRTQDTAVKITPASAGPVTSTTLIA